MTDHIDRSDELREMHTEDVRREYAQRNGYHPDDPGPPEPPPDDEPAQDAQGGAAQGVEDRAEHQHDDRHEVVYPAPSAPFAVADQLYADYRTDADMRTLVAWRGGWMRWRTTHWSEIDTAELRSHIYEMLHKVVYEHVTKDGTELKPWNPDKRKVANVLEAMAAIGHLKTDIDSPAWIDLHSAAETSAMQMISCKNGLLDVSSRTIHDHTPALFNIVSVPFAYQQDVEAPPEWLAFLDSLWPDDRDSILLLQQYFGYVLSGRLDMQKLLLLIGQLVGQDHEPGRQLPRPRLAILAVDGQRVLAGDREQPLHHGVRRDVAQTGIRDDRQRLAYQRRDSKVGA